MGATERERAEQSLWRHAPDLSGATIDDLGRGLDHVAYLVGDLVLRTGDPVDVTREARLLDVVGPRVPLPVPVPRFVDAECGVLAYPMLAGRPLLGRVPPYRAARRLGRFLRALHAIGPETLDDAAARETADPQEWLDELTGPAHLVSAVEAEVPQTAEHLVLCHADLGAEHLLEQGGALTGVIDWSDAAVTDPALDFARLLRDFGPAFLDSALDAYGGLDIDARRRITFFARCSALEDLRYGETAGRRDYADAAVRSFAWLFP